jgi:flagellar motility protein MotE (MotC chaperone)
MQGFSASELEVLQSLSRRRAELDARERKIEQREALLTAAGQEVDHKIAELNRLKGEIEELLGKQQKMEEERLASLVKIYENMKPKEAAVIFNTLDLDVLLAIIGRMNERKATLIFQEMDPEKARIVTIRLSEQRKLPPAPAGLTPQKP